MYIITLCFSPNLYLYVVYTTKWKMLVASRQLAWVRERENRSNPGVAWNDACQVLYRRTHEAVSHGGRWRPYSFVHWFIAIWFFYLRLHTKSFRRIKTKGIWGNTARAYRSGKYSVSLNVKHSAVVTICTTYFKIQRLGISYLCFPFSSYNKQRLFHRAKKDLFVL